MDASALTEEGCRIRDAFLALTDTIAELYNEYPREELIADGSHRHIELAKRLIATGHITGAALDRLRSIAGIRAPRKRLRRVLGTTHVV